MTEYKVTVSATPIKDEIGQGDLYPISTVGKINGIKVRHALGYLRISRSPNSIDVGPMTLDADLSEERVDGLRREVRSEILARFIEAGVVVNFSPDLQSPEAVPVDVLTDQVSTE